VPFGADVIVEIDLATAPDSDPIALGRQTTQRGLVVDGELTGARAFALTEFLLIEHNQQFCNGLVDLARPG
jgi:hypothetical protein